MIIRWTGWGILVIPLIFLACLGGPGAAYTLFQDQANPHGDGIERGGVLFGGFAVAAILGAGLCYLLGMALNRRRLSDGRWRWTDRHQIADTPVQDFAYVMALIGLLALPLTAIGFTSAGVVWALLIGWAVVVITAAVLAYRRYNAPNKARR